MKLSRQLTVVLVLSVATVGVGLMLLRGSRPASTPAANPSPIASPATSSNSIRALGRLAPEGEIIKIAAPSSAGMGTSRVAKLLVQEGSTVKAGQIMAVMDNSDTQLATAAQAESQVREAQARLEQVRAGAKQGDLDAQQSQILRLQAELQNAELELQRYQNLYQNGAISIQERDRRALTVATTRQQLQQAQQQFVSLAEVRPTDLQQAEAQVAVATANLQRAKADLENAFVRSPISGQVIKIHSRPGESVSNKGILELGRTSQMYAVAVVDETRITQVRLGQRARITSSNAAFDGEIFGTVAQIGKQVLENEILIKDTAANKDIRVIEVKIKLDDSSKVASLTNSRVDVVIEP